MATTPNLVKYLSKEVKDMDMTINGVEKEVLEALRKFFSPRVKGEHHYYIQTLYQERCFLLSVGIRKSRKIAASRVKVPFGPDMVEEICEKLSEKLKERYRLG
ncbi:hypothetical protein M3P19_13840 [Muricauda sp. 2012CJ35-5]|uniref:Uncharacterized protein n=1 Tax=Flagellimonas spongiicola TaxID=2942208 RepID=A0ABT0PVT6_9FLAO|nr:hypothetical protein [Allomuricauda spongiicola]MCL6275096.1 hypothetical protein [Allomuricauda spongiicola]